MTERFDIEYKDFFKVRKQIKVDITGDVRLLQASMNRLERKISATDSSQREEQASMFKLLLEALNIDYLTQQRDIEDRRKVNLLGAKKNCDIIRENTRVDGKWQ